MSEPQEPTAAEVREGAVRLLARREHSAEELAVKLARRGWPETLVWQVLDELSDAGLQSDRRFAEAFARQRAERCYGPRRIDAELRQRGIDRALIAEALDSLDVDFSERAESFYRRRYVDDADVLTYPERARRAQALARRGFGPEHFRDLLET
jgi:regulatory protein